MKNSMFEHIKPGALSKMLGIPVKDNIPFTLLEKIRRTPIGDTITNPTKRGRNTIKVTKLLKKRAVLALNAKRITQKRFG
ncbi:MAG: hypothetical protein WC489_06205 [Patescibacteria group bacterium]|jgi:hypothetical protein